MTVWKHGARRNGVAPPQSKEVSPELHRHDDKDRHHDRTVRITGTGFPQA